MVPKVEEWEFIPPADAVNLANKRVTGVPEQPLQPVFPEWPTSFRQQHFLVSVEIVIGKDGHVISAHAVSGPPETYKAAENAVKKWTFRPYLVLGDPVEVESKVQLSNN
jgi:protein TonB